MTKSKTDKHLTLSYKKTISKSDLHPLKGVGNGKIDVKRIDDPFADLLSFAAKEKASRPSKTNKIKWPNPRQTNTSHCPTKNYLQKWPTPP